MSVYVYSLPNPKHKYMWGADEINNVYTPMNLCPGNGGQTLTCTTATTGRTEGCPPAVNRGLACRSRRHSLLVYCLLMLTWTQPSSLASLSALATSLLPLRSSLLRHATTYSGSSSYVAFIVSGPSNRSLLCLFSRAIQSRFLSTWVTARRFFQNLVAFAYTQRICRVFTSSASPRQPGKNARLGDDDSSDTVSSLHSPRCSKST